jgi:hypothetical protein
VPTTTTWCHLLKLNFTDATSGFGSINLLSVINKRERASWLARSLVRWRRGQLQRILEVHSEGGDEFIVTGLAIKHTLAPIPHPWWVW